MTQDGNMEQVTQIWYEEQHSMGLNDEMIYCGVNLYGHDVKGVKRLLGTFEDLDEAKNELIKINNSKDFIKQITIY